MDADGAKDGDGLGTKERLGIIDGFIEGFIESDGDIVGKWVISEKQKLHDSGQASLIVLPP